MFQFHSVNKDTSADTGLIRQITFTFLQ